MRPRNSICHTFALVDTSSGEVLWFNRQSFECQDPRSGTALPQTVKETLVDLPTTKEAAAECARPRAQE